MCVKHRFVQNASTGLKVCTCHASNNSRCFDDISHLHVLCGNDPSFPAASSYKRNVGRPACTIMTSSGCSACMLSKGPCGKMLTCTGRIALRPPSPQRAGPLCQPHSAVVESLSYGIFVCGLRRCRVSEPFLRGRQQGEQLFLVHLNYSWMTLVYVT